MEVFGKGTDEPSRPLLPPGLCWICDQSPQQEAIRVIDTRRNSRPGQTAIHTTERKYICETCALEMGAAMGMVKAEEHARVSEQATEWQNQAITMSERLEAAEAEKVKVIPARDVQDFLSTFKAEMDALRAEPERMPGDKYGDSAPASDE